MTSTSSAGDRRDLTLVLAGDVMTGRGIDQILPHPSDPRIYEPWVQSALDYVALAEDEAGPLPRRVAPDYIWGDVLAAVRRRQPDAFVVNLETAITDHDEPWAGKGIQYRMHPENAAVLTVAGVDVVSLANNHVLDWSVAGLEQTLRVLDAHGVRAAGAGRDRDEAWQPVWLPTRSSNGVVVLAAGTASSGVPSGWAARADRPGVAFLPSFTDDAVDYIAALVADAARPGDIVVMSLHWGPNWGYEIAAEHRRFAHALVDRAGVHIVHGHSSHHPLGIEVYRDRLILYGCGDLVTDYEGIHGHAEYRGELGALYLPTFDGATGNLQRLELVPTKMARFQLTRPAPGDVEWLSAVLHREGAPLGTAVGVADDTTLAVTW